MLFLLLTILFTTAIYVVFKMFERKGVQLFPAIVVNYITALSLGIIFIPNRTLAWQGASQMPTWFVGALCLGVFFISVFYITGLAAQRIGMSVTTIASKMSLVIAMALFIALRPHEHLTWGKGLAMLLAIAGVVLSSLKEGGAKFQWKQLGWPLLVLVGSTIVDFGVAYFSSGPSNASETALYSCTSFATAAVCGILALITLVATGKITVRPKDVAGGLVLGTVNYSSIYTMVLAFKSNWMTESAMLPIINLGVVILGSIVAVIAFRERLTKVNGIGLLLAIAAICCLLLTS
jgi:drug/metabolite transporter (DMT)-like permease